MHSLRVEQIFGSYFDGFLLQLGCEKSVGLTDLSISFFSDSLFWKFIQRRYFNVLNTSTVNKFYSVSYNFTFVFMSIFFLIFALYSLILLGLFFQFALI